MSNFGKHCGEQMDAVIFDHDLIKKSVMLNFEHFNKLWNDIMYIMSGVRKDYQNVFDNRK
jgi:hypothetical protein